MLKISKLGLIIAVYLFVIFLAYFTSVFHIYILEELGASDKGFENSCLLLIHSTGHTPDAGHLCIYTKNDNTLHHIDSAGNDFKLLGEDENGDVSITNDLTIGGTVTAANAVFNLKKCSLTKSSDQAIAADANWHSISFDGEGLDVGDMHDNTTNNERITIVKATNYVLHYQVKIEIGDKMSVEARILKNGTTPLSGACSVIVGSKDASFGAINIISSIISPSVNDYYVIEVKHDGDSAIDVIANNTYFAAREIL